MDTDIYQQMEEMYNNSKKRRSFLKKSTANNVTILKPIESVKKFYNGHKAVYWDNNKHKDESNARYYFRFEIEHEGELLYWDVVDHMLGDIMPYIGKTVDYVIEHRGKWQKNKLHIIESKLDEESNRKTEDTRATTELPEAASQELPKGKSPEEPSRLEAAIPGASEAERGVTPGESPGKIREPQVEEPVAEPAEDPVAENLEEIVENILKETDYENDNLDKLAMFLSEKIHHETSELCLRSVSIEFGVDEMVIDHILASSMVPTMNYRRILQYIKDSVLEKISE